MTRSLMLLSMILLAPVVAAAQEPAVTLDLGIDAPLRGAKATMSVVMAVKEGTPALRGVEFEATFPSKVLTLKEVAKGTGATRADAEVKTELVKSTDAPGDMILRVRVSSAKAIPEGPLVSLVFDVAKVVKGEKPERQVKLKAGPATARSEAGPVTARATDGTLNILSENSAVFACFFYMH